EALTGGQREALTPLQGRRGCRAVGAFPAAECGVHRSPARWPTRSVGHPTIWRPAAAPPGGQERRCPRYESAINSVPVLDAGRSASSRPPGAVCTEALTGGQREAWTKLGSVAGRYSARWTRTTVASIRILDHFRANAWCGA